MVEFYDLEKEEILSTQTALPDQLGRSVVGKGDTFPPCHRRKMSKGGSSQNARGEEKCSLHFKDSHSETLVRRLRFAVAVTGPRKSRKKKL